jgi:RNA methyltransferase, TrmH family
VITSSHNEQLKTIRKLHDKRWREKLDLFAAEGEDLVDAAAAAGVEPEILLRAGEDVEPELLAEVSALGSGTRVIGVYRRRWSQPGGALSVYLHGVHDPGNVGTVIRSAHALCDGPVVLGPGCADPYAPKAVRASMGSVFARPPARAGFEELDGKRIALDAGADRPLAEVAAELEPAGTDVARGDAPGAEPARVVLCLGAEREGLPPEVLAAADAVGRIPLRAGGPESLNVAMAATVALYELATRMPRHA